MTGASVRWPAWVWGSRCLYNLGDQKNPGARRIVKADHRLRFDPETKHFLGGTFVNTLDNGVVKEIEYEQIGRQVAYLRCAGYASPQGGSPDDHFYHGMFVGEDVVTGRSDDIDDPKVRMHLAGFDDHLCQARCDGETTVGIIECMNPVLFEMCRDNAPGFSLLPN